MQGSWNTVPNIAQVPGEEVALFLAKSMMCNVIATAGGSDGNDPQWQPVLATLWSHKFELA